MREGERMTTQATVINHFTTGTLTTNAVMHSFAPERIYPGARLRVLGHTRMNGSTLTATPALNGIAHGVERTDGIWLGFTIDNVGGSLNTTHMAMEDYTVQVVLPILHNLDNRTNVGLDVTPVFILIDENGNETATRIPIERISVEREHLTAPTTITWDLSGEAFRLLPNQRARIEFFTQTHLGGNADPLFFEAYLIPNGEDATQYFNRARVANGFVMPREGTPALASFASVFIVGIHTTLAHAEVRGDNGEFALGDQGNNMISITPGRYITYTMVLENTSPVPYNNISLIGRMPHLNDSVVINANIPRQSDFGIDFVEIGDIHIDGVLQTADVRFMRNVGDFNIVNWNGNGWNEHPTWNSGDEGQSYRIALPAGVELGPGEVLTVELRAYVPSGDLAGGVAWKSFAYQYRPTNMPALNLRTEISVVGVHLAGFNIEHIIEGYNDGSDFEILVEGNFRSLPNYRMITFTADDFRDGNRAIRSVPDLMVGETYRISQPNPGIYTSEINFSEIEILPRVANVVTVINAFEIPERDITVNMDWVGDGNYPQFRPDEVTVRMYADGEFGGEFTLAYPSWSATLAELPRYARFGGNSEGMLVAYTFETELPRQARFGGNSEGMPIAYTFETELPRQARFDENNEWIPIVYTFEVVDIPAFYNVEVGELVFVDEGDYTMTIAATFDRPNLDIQVNNTWTGDENHLQLRPDELIVRLYADGAFDGELTLSDPNWFAAFDELPRYSAPDVPIVYTIGGLDVSDYYTVEIGALVLVLDEAGESTDVYHVEIRSVFTHEDEAEETEPIEPTEPVEPAEPTEPVEPAEPAEPTEPVEPTPQPRPNLPQTGTVILGTAVFGGAVVASGLAVALKKKKKECA